VRWLATLVVTSSCVTASASLMVGPVLSLAYPASGVADGSGALGSDSVLRLAARKQTAQATATSDALDAAIARPTDVRLQRRAVAMVRELAGGSNKGVAVMADRAGRVIDHLVETTPCPGLSDAGATWLALADAKRSGESYVRAARQCDNVEAAVAAVQPLHSLGRCDDAIAALREAWPHAKGELGIAVLDGVATCSDAITLRRNLGFAPPDVVEDYFALLEARHREAVEQERRAEAQRRDEEAREQAAAASSRCESECSAAVSSCSSSCVGDAQCNQSCDAVGHACRSGC